jgi:hypothetical protein
MCVILGHDTELVYFNIRLLNLGLRVIFGTSSDNIEHHISTCRAFLNWKITQDERLFLLPVHCTPFSAPYLSSFLLNLRLLEVVTVI